MVINLKKKKTFKNTASHHTISTPHKLFSSTSNFIFFFLHFSRWSHLLLFRETASDRGSFILIPNLSSNHSSFPLWWKRNYPPPMRLITFTLDLISGIIYQLYILFHIHSTSISQMNSSFQFWSTLISPQFKHMKPNNLHLDSPTPFWAKFLQKYCLNGLISYSCQSDFHLSSNQNNTLQSTTPLCCYIISWLLIGFKICHPPSETISSPILKILTFLLFFWPFFGGGGSPL